MGLGGWDSQLWLRSQALRLQGSPKGLQPGAWEEGRQEGSRRDRGERWSRRGQDLTAPGQVNEELPVPHLARSSGGQAWTSTGLPDLEGRKEGAGLPEPLLT